MGGRVGVGKVILKDYLRSLVFGVIYPGLKEGDR